MSEDWPLHAACKGRTDEMFAPEDMPKGDRPAFYRRAKSICRGCPVRMECLVWAITNPAVLGYIGHGDDRIKKDPGVLGGLSPNELYEMKWKRAVAA